MATVRLGRNECENGQLPLVCMRCGAAAENLVQQELSWHDEWLALSLLFGIVPYFLLAPLHTWRMTIHAPLCSMHRGHWTNRKLFTTFMPIAVFSSAISFLAFHNTTLFPGELQDQLKTLTAVGLSLLVLIWVILSVVWDFNIIKIVNIDYHSITLKRVAPAFVAAVQAQA
jgi:hypothetical protein